MGSAAGGNDLVHRNMVRLKMKDVLFQQAGNSCHDGGCHMEAVVAGVQTVKDAAGSGVIVRRIDTCDIGKEDRKVGEITCFNSAFKFLVGIAV